MEDYLFRHYVDQCRVVKEETSYVEIFNYSVSHHLHKRLHKKSLSTKIPIDLLMRPSGSLLQCMRRTSFTRR